VRGLVGKATSARPETWANGPLILVLLAAQFVWPMLVRAATFTHSSQGYMLQYPDSWQAEEFNEGVTIKDFSAYEHGGVLPDGGSDIRIDPYPPAVNDYELVKYLSEFGSNVEITTDPMKARFQELPNGTTKFVIPFRRSGRLFVLMLQYQTNNPNASHLELIANNIATSFTAPALPATPTPAGNLIILPES
jgi:hypothetical protein